MAWTLGRRVIDVDYNELDMSDGLMHKTHCDNLSLGNGHHLNRRRTDLFVGRLLGHSRSRR